MDLKRDLIISEFKNSGIKLVNFRKQVNLSEAGVWGVCRVKVAFLSVKCLLICKFPARHGSQLEVDIVNVQHCKRGEPIANPVLKAV